MRSIKIVLVAILGCGILQPFAQAAEPKVLNNLVTELVNLESIPAKPAYQEIAFTNPREGWVFISGTTRLDISGQAVENDDIVKISIDDASKEDAVLNYQFGDATTKETMRFLSAGEHKLRIWFPEKPELATLDIRNLIVRAVPAMVYTAHPVVSRGYFGVYDEEFLAKDVLPNTNTIIGDGRVQYQNLHKEWKARGGKWYLEQNLPSLLRDSECKDAPNPLTADYAYDFWTNSLGFTSPYLDGVSADEFLWKDDQIPDYPAYTEALKRIAANPEFKNKKVYGWTFGKEIYTEPAGKELLQAFIDSGGKIAWEFYPDELPTEAAMRQRLYGKLSQTIKDWEKNIPGMVKHVIFTPGYFCAPPMSLNTNPAVDFKVQLDMQFNYLANAPECYGLYGIMVWKARYADEEIVRWTGRLFRHYWIEGKRNRLSDEFGFKYIPGHITNPDFDDGLEGWSVAAAAPNSVQTGTMGHLSEMQGRFMTSQGDNYLLTKRSADKPNQVSQKIKKLIPGKLYSAKIYVADYQDYVKGESVRKRLAVSLDIDNVNMVPGKCLVLEVDISSSGLSSVGPFKGKTPPWMNVHRLVFRALDTTAKLTISDWTDETTPGGPIGQEILYNFVEVQPYIED